MKYIHYLLFEGPAELRICSVSGIAGGTIGTIYQFMTDAEVLKFVSALSAFGGLITMILGWIFWLRKIKKGE